MAEAVPNQGVRQSVGRWHYRAIAILLGLSPLIFLEIALRLGGAENLHAFSDPFVQFKAVMPLFELNSAGDRYVIPPSRQPFFKRDSFSAKKSANGFRIFCLGGSTVQGNPYSIETSFTSWLELSLQAAQPSRDWEVINCGGISYASYRLEPILRECLKYEPDLFILYVGDNEFLEQRTFVEARAQSPWSQKLYSMLAHLRIFQLSRHYWISKSRSLAPTSSVTSLNAEVDALLDYQGGLAQYHRDPQWRQGVAEHFGFAFSSMLAQANAAQVPVFVIDPVSNIKDCPPFKVEADPQLDAARQERLNDLLTDANAAAENLERRIELLEQAREIDEGHAAVHFQLGQTFLAAGRDEEARKSLLRAKDEDVCPLRMTEPLRQILYSACENSGMTVVPVLAEFSRRSPHGIPGDEWLLDHVHPTISGQQLIADLLIEQIVQRDWVTADSGWETRRQQLYKEHLATLDAPYYARGQEHLEGLRRWTSGRVRKLRQNP